MDDKTYTHSEEFHKDDWSYEDGVDAAHDLLSAARATGAERLEILRRIELNQDMMPYVDQELDRLAQWVGVRTTDPSVPSGLTEELIATARHFKDHMPLDCGDEPQMNRLKPGFSI